MMNRELYKKIKNMNRQELDEYLNSVFIQGHNNGVAAMSAVIVDKVDRGLRMTPGIGEKRYQEIMDNIVKCMREDDTNEQPGDTRFRDREGEVK